MSENKTSALDGWSNLTQAIQGGVDIDWKKLNKSPAKCVHPELGVLTYRPERDPEWVATDYDGWVLEDANYPWRATFANAWKGHEDWELYIKGEIPLKRKAAEQLTPGTCFYGVHRKSGETIYAILVQHRNGTVSIFSKCGVAFTHPPEEVEVIQTYGLGTFNI